MKKNIIILKTCLLLLAIMCMNMKCHPHDCDVTAATNYSASVNVYDEVLGIYTQTFNTYSDVQCGTAKSSTDLKITNLTPYTASYSYTISYTLNEVSWSKQGSVTIGPQATVDVGTINNSAAEIDLGQLIVTYYNVSYR
jgi:hypothetical protein